MNELADPHHGVGSLFSRPCVRWPEQHLRVPQWIPLVAVSESARGYLVKVELPQVKQEDAKITIKDGTLTITGDRKFNLNRKKDYHVEHAYGRFAHSFEVPADARPAKVSAVFKRGVLTFHLAKRSCVSSASRLRVFLLPNVAPAPQESI